MTETELYSLRPGYDISRVIRGGWQLAGGNGAIDRQQAVTDLVATFDAGIFTYDCADIYTGVDYTIDLTKPVGQRVTKLQFNGADVTPDQTFRIAINNYRASGGGQRYWHRTAIWASTRPPGRGLLNHAARSPR